YVKAKYIMKDPRWTLWLGRCAIYRLLLLSLVLYSAYSQSVAQDLEFQNFSTRHGLSQSNVWDIMQDRKGFIWVGTEDGLNVYDGYTFTIYRNDPLDSSSLSNSNIHCIKEDKEGNLWIGTRFGLNVFDPRTQKFEIFLHDP